MTVTSDIERSWNPIHDFAPVALPFDAVVGGFLHYVDHRLVEDLVLDAWRSEALALIRAGAPLKVPHERATRTTPAVAARLGRPRGRLDSLIVPVQWESRSTVWIPPMQGDLEVVSFGPHRTHLHLLGRSQLSPSTQPCTQAASLEHRLGIATCRHALTALANGLFERSQH